MEIMELERKKRTTKGNKTTLKKSCRLMSSVVVNMKLLAFLLIITEIFILFNLTVVYGSDGDRKGDSHWQPSSLLLANQLTHNRQDNIKAKEFPRYKDDQEQMIREEIATTYAPTETCTKFYVPASQPSESHQIIELGLFSAKSPLLLLPASSSSSSSLSELKNKELDRYHHSSGSSHRRQLAEADVDVNVALAAAAAAIPSESNVSAGASTKEAAGWRKSNLLIEQQQQQHTRSKRALDNDDTSAGGSISTSEDSLLRSPTSSDDNSGEINNNRNEEQDVDGQRKEFAPSEYRRVHHLAKDKYLSVRGSKNIRPHLSVENHYQGLASRFRSKNGLCRRDCSHVVNGRRILNGAQQPNNRPPNTDDRSSSSSSGKNGNNSINGLELSAHSYRICGSDGQLYNSMCELRLQACRQNLHLFRVPRSFCAKLPEQQQQQPSNGLDLLPTSGKPLDVSQEMVDLQKYKINKHNNNGSEEVRIVELKRRCNLLAYNEMKLLLIREFIGDVSSMFNYFDINGDNYIEAHELWPRQTDVTNRLRYAQLWDEHSSKCRKLSSPVSIQEINHHSFHSISHKTPIHLNGNEEEEENHIKHCWFFLDFAFEPQFAPNPCSLSHLMLFDLKHPNNRFDLETFKRAFEEPRSLWANENEIKEQQDTSRHNIRQVNYSSIKGEKSDPKTITDTIATTTTTTTTSRIQIMLGDSVALACMANRAGQWEKSEKNGLITESEGLDDGIRCLWTRYNLNLGASQDPHIHVEKRLTQKKDNGKKFYDLMLGLRDAQLYLSGHFKCACYSKKFKQTFEHQYFVQVSGKFT